MSPGWFSDLKSAQAEVIRARLSGNDDAHAKAVAALRDKLVEHGARIFSILGLFYDDQELHALILAAVLDDPNKAGERFRKMAENYVTRHAN